MVPLHSDRNSAFSISIEPALCLCSRVGMPLDDALALIQRRRPDAEPIPDFMDMLRQYEAQCRRDGAIVDQLDELSRKNKKRTATAAADPAAGPASKSAAGPQKRSVVGPVPGLVNVAVGPAAHSSRSIGPAVKGQDEPLNDRASSSTLSNASCRNRKESSKELGGSLATSDSQRSAHESIEE